MSKRRDRRRTAERPDRAGQPARGDQPPRAERPARAGRATRDDGPGHWLRGGILRDVAILVAAFAIGVGAAELFGAANLGVAFGVGQVVFALTLVVLLSRG
jgi:hypothetical protein